MIRAELKKLRRRVTITVPSFWLEASNPRTGEIVEGDPVRVVDHMLEWLADGDTAVLRPERGDYRAYKAENQ